MLTILYFIINLLWIICILITTAYYTVSERKVMAAIQRRQGPYRVGFMGLLQAFADALKLLAKEIVIPAKTNSNLFIIAPLILLSLSFISWEFISFKQHTFRANVNYGLITLLAISSLNVYSIIISGWSSNSKYSFLGALRSAAQMISYEVSISILVLPVLLLAESFNFEAIIVKQLNVYIFLFVLIFCGVIFFISILAETNRAPFDLPEAEAELVAGYNVEYSSIIFAMFFLGEYTNMLLMSTLVVIMFLGGWWAPTILQILHININLFLITKILFCSFMFILVRAAFPRYRYDQLMEIGWKTLMPITSGFALLILGFIL